MFDGLFGDETPHLFESSKEVSHKTCADTVEIPPEKKTRFAGLKNQVL